MSAARRCLSAAVASILLVTWPTAPLHGQSTTRQSSARQPLEWGRYHFDLANTAFNPHESLLTPINVTDLAPAWTLETGSLAYSSPVVAKGRVFIGTATGRFYIADEHTGAVLKTFELGQNGYSSGAAATAAIDGDRMFMQDANGGLMAYDFVHDIDLWFVPPPDGYAGGFASPAVFDGKVYQGISNGTGDSPCNVGRVQCFDETSGVLLWDLDMVPPGYVGGGVWNAIAIDVPRRLVITATGNPPNGNPSCGAAIPCGTPGDLTDAIVALDCDTGALVWSYTAIYCDSFDLDFGSSSVVLFDDGVHDLAGAGSKNGVFYAVDRNTGSLAWAADLNGLCSNGCGELFSAAGFAYGKLFLTPGTSFPSVAIALDPGNGNVLWSQSSQARGYCGPAIAGGMVFTGISNTIAALDQNTGAILWSYGMGSPIWSNPAVVNGSLYVMSKRGRLTKFSLP